MKKKTHFFNNAERAWVTIDARNKVLGRLCAQIAMILMGKTKAQYTPNMLTGDKVIVLNASEIKVTGNKAAQKRYKKYTQYPGGLREIGLDVVLAKNPGKAIYNGVKGMLPKTMLGRRMIRCLKIYNDDKHALIAQKPQEVKV